MQSSQKSAQLPAPPAFPVAGAAPGRTDAPQVSSIASASASSQEKPASAKPERGAAKTPSSSWGAIVVSLLGGFGLGAAVGYFLAPAPPLDETRFLNFDAESTPEGYLLAGFSGPEVTEEGDSFRWCDAPVARVKVRSRADGDRTLRVRFWPFVYPGGPAQSVSVYVNEKLVRVRDMAHGPHIGVFRVPAYFWRKGDNEIRFKFTYAETPKLRTPPSQDVRTLSAAFDWLEILPP